jgi:small-conductance mechanosensitive channel
MLAGISQELVGLWNDQIAAQLGLFIWRSVLALLALIVIWLASRITHGAIRRALSRTRAHPNARVLLDRAGQFLVFLLAAAWILSIYGVQLTALLAVLGAGALAVSLALQDVLKNLVAGLYILVERPFSIGDHIEFKTFSGAVETIELRTTALRTAAGQRVIIPNAMIFADTLVNRSAYGRQLLRVRIVLPADGATRESTDQVISTLRAALPTALAPTHASASTGFVAPLFNSNNSKDTAASSSIGPLTVTIESMTAEKLTLRAEAAVPDARAVAPEVMWALREKLPHADLTILD